MRQIGWLIAGVLLTVTPAKAADDTNREIARNYASFNLEQGDYLSAVTDLREHLSSDMGDFGAWNLLGVAYLWANKPKYAAEAFQGAYRRAPDSEKGVYLYNYADASARAGNLLAARTGLREAKADERTAPAAEAALAKLESGKALPPLKLTRPLEWRGSMTLASGLDTNVILASDASLATSVDTGISSPSVAPAFQVARYKDLGTRSLLLGGATSFTYYSLPDVQTYNAFSTGLYGIWGEGSESRSRIGVSVADDLDVTFLNSNGMRLYNWNHGIGPRIVFKLSAVHEAELEIPLRYQRFAIEDGNDLADDRTGFGFRPAFTYRRSFGLNLLTLGVQYEKHLARGTNYRATTVTFPVSWSQRRFFGGTWAVFDFEYSTVNYGESTTGRSDRSIKGGMTVTRRFGAKILGNLGYLARRNTSNLESSQYMKHQMLLTGSYELF